MNIAHAGRLSSKLEPAAAAAVAEATAVMAMNNRFDSVIFRGVLIWCVNFALPQF